MLTPDKNKKGYVEIISGIFERIGGWSYDHRWIVLLICVLFIGISGYFASGVTFDNSFEAFFDPDDPAYVEFLQYREDFGSDEISYIMYEAPDYEHGPWNLEVMRKIEKLTKAIEEEAPFVKEATSLANVEFIEGAPGRLIVYDLLSNFPEDQSELLKIRDKVLKKPMYIGGLVSKDAKYAAIIVEMEKSSIDPLGDIMVDPEKGNALENLYPQATHKKIEDILKRPEFKGVKFYHSGDVPLNAEYNTITQVESETLSIISFIIIAGLLTFFFKRIIGVVGPLAVVALSILITIGFIGVLGWDFDLMFIMLPTLLIVVGVADSVHIVTEFRFYQRRLGDRKEAIKRSIYLVGVPCLFTSLTTVAGFTSMSISPIKSLKHFAVYSAFGVASAFLLTVTLLVVFLSFGRKETEKEVTKENNKKVKGSTLLYRFLEGVSRLDIRHYKSIVAISCAVFIFFAIGLTKLEVDSNWLNEYSEDVEVRRTTEIIDNVMGGTGGYSYIFNTNEEEGILDPKILRQIDVLQQRANQETGIVMKTYSIVDLIKDINQSFHDGDPKYYTIPDDKQLIAQYLLLYEMSGGDELANYISSDYSRANLEIRTKLIATSIFDKLVDRLDEYLKTQHNLEVVPSVNGIGALWLKLIDYIVESQVRGFLLAFTVIATMMCLLFKSFKLGMLSMIPNLTPVFVTLGLMGWAGITLDYTKLLVGCVAISIAVDDTIHLVTRFRHEFLQKGNYGEALTASMKDVGRAISITSMVLVSGFLVFLLSAMDSIFYFGILLVVTLSLALIADFFLMPALVLLFKPFGPEKEAAVPVEAEV